MQQHGGRERPDAGKRPRLDEQRGGPGQLHPVMNQHVVERRMDIAADDRGYLRQRLPAGVEREILVTPGWQQIQAPEQECGLYDEARRQKRMLDPGCWMLVGSGH